MLNLSKKDNKNILLIKSIFIRTSLFFVSAYFIFHFMNGNISFSPLEDKRALLKQSSQILLDKEKKLLFKELMISKLNNSKENLDLLDELVRTKLGYSDINEVIYSKK